MALVLTRNDNQEFKVTQLRFLRSSKTFVASDKTTKDSIEFKYSLEPDDRFKTKESDFEIYLFHRDTFATNDVFQVKIEDKRLGWLFPIQALLSSEHDYFNNEHFFPYSYNAYRLLLKNSNNLPYKKISLEEQPTLENIYGENTIVLAVYKKYLKELRSEKGFKFKIDEYLLFFYQFGYTLLSQINFDSFYELKAETTILKNFESTSINVNRISEDLIDDKPYLNSLIQGLIKLERHPLVKFHLMYSVMELFISKIFESDFKSSLQGFLTSTDFYDAKEKLGKIANEKGRINKLFSVNCPGIDHSLLEDLKNACNSFLSFAFAPRVFKKGAGDAIYKVRSTIFHNLRHLPAGYESELDTVLKKLELLILDISLKLRLT